MNCTSDNLCFVDSLCVKEYQTYLSNVDCDKNNIENANYFIVVAVIVTVIVLFFSLLGVGLLWIIFKWDKIVECCCCCKKEKNSKVANNTFSNQKIMETLKIDDSIEK